MTDFTPLEKETEILNNTVPSMAYKGEEPFEAWQERARKKLAELLGMDRHSHCDYDFSVEYRKEEADFIDTRFVFQSEPGYYVPCHLLEPKEKIYENPPLMICLQGHSTGMHISLGRAKYPGDRETIDGERDFALQCIKRGFVAVATEQRCFGEKGGTPKPDCYQSSATAILMGRTVLGDRVWDIQRLIQVLKNRFSERFDSEKIYCFGNSGGGTATFYAAALTPDIAGGMPSCSFASFGESIAAVHHCLCNFVPHIREYFDMAELGGMIAPRPLVVVSGQKDGIFPVDSAKSEFYRLKNTYYKSADAEENCLHIIGEEGHRFYVDPSWGEFIKLISRGAEADVNTPCR